MCGLCRHTQYANSVQVHGCLYNAKEHGSRATPYVAFCLTRATCKTADLMTFCSAINYKNTNIIDIESNVLDQKYQNRP